MSKGVNVQRCKKINNIYYTFGHLKRLLFFYLLYNIMADLERITNLEQLEIGKTYLFEYHKEFFENDFDLMGQPMVSYLEIY